MFASLYQKTALYQRAAENSVLKQNMKKSGLFFPQLSISLLSDKNHRFRLFLYL
jgi:hypothetical protein